MGDFNYMHLVVLFLLTFVEFASCTINISDGGANHVIGCIDAERRALLDLKQGFTIDPSGRLSSWQGEDCCKWMGVHCNNNTGHVVKLDLRMSSIGGGISPSLLHLKHLRHLDLSYNHFKGITIPKFIGGLKLLRYLDLSRACFTGTIPPHLGNLSRLIYLNLYSLCLEDVGSSPYLNADSLHWLSGLTSLRYLNMERVNLTMADDGWLDHHVNMLPALQELHLVACELRSLPSSISVVNFTSLLVLDLSENKLNASIPHWVMDLHSLSTLYLAVNNLQGHIPNALGAMTSLQYLELSSNRINGKMPSSFGNLCNLRELVLAENNISGGITQMLDGLSLCPKKSLELLDLSHNQLTGVLPDSLGSYKNLKVLDVSENDMNGPIPENIGKLSELVSLRLSLNLFEGFISESHFANLTKLRWLDLSSSASEKSRVILNVSSNWVPPFSSLTFANMNNRPLGPSVPSWLQSQKQLAALSLRNTSISGTFPRWVWELSWLRFLDLSFNKIIGGIHLEQNAIHPLFVPQSFPNLTQLLLKGNLLSGFIPPNIGRLMPNLRMLDLSMNNITGTIPSSICELTHQLQTLILSNNKLTGNLPQRCWKDLKSLDYVDLSNNHLMGKVPSSLLVLSSLETLKLSNNKFYGELPSSIRNQSALTVMDLGENGLTGKVPSWIGNGFPHLRILRLHSNHFIGGIPTQICSLSSLQVLDLGGNELSGTVPHCFGTFSAMAKVNNDNDFENIGVFLYAYVWDPYFFYASIIVCKGTELDFSSNLRFLRSIDLSNNNLSGDLPQELTELVGLGILNLSRNHFEGMIPEKIGKMEQLESLDLSHNQLLGPIPPSIASLSFLNHLNLSYNNLEGRIPSGNQLQTLSNASIYEGNPHLCGPPLADKCEWYETTEEGAPSALGKKDEEDEARMPPFFIGMLFGSIIGFWGVWGALILRKSWRHSYFRLVDGIIDRIYVFVAVKMNRIQGRM